MLPGKFSDKDAERLAKLMATVIREAKFERSMNSFVELFNEFDWVNKELIPKIKANILEIKSLQQVEKKEEPKKPSSRSRKK